MYTVQIIFFRRAQIQRSREFNLPKTDSLVRQKEKKTEQTFKIKMNTCPLFHVKKMIIMDLYYTHNPQMHL